MTTKYGDMDWPKKQDWIEWYLERTEDMVQVFYDIVNWAWFDRRKQKIQVTIDPWDTWSMDHTLAPIILPMLKQLKQNNPGAPDVDDKDVPAHLHPKGRDKWGTDETYFERWNWVLDEMIWAFEQKCRGNWEGDYYKYEDDPDSKFGLKLVWEDPEGMKKHQERMSNAFKLFGKYYESLWE